MVRVRGIRLLARQHVHANQTVTRQQLHGFHAPRLATQHPQLPVVDANVHGHAVTRADQHAVAVPGNPHPSQGVTVLQVDGNQAAGADGGKGAEGGPFDESGACEHQQLLVFAEGVHGNQGGDLLFSRDGKQLNNGGALRGAAGNGHLVGR